MKPPHTVGACAVGPHVRLGPIRPRRLDRQPRCSLGDGVLLSGRYVATVVVLPNKRTFRVGPLQDNEFALEIRQGHWLASDVHRSKRGGGFADHRLC